MNDDDLKRTAWAAALIAPSIGADDMLTEILTQADTQQIIWLPFPSPAGMRVFQGTSEVYTILAIQANVHGTGLVHRATATAIGRKFNVLNLPPAMADFLFHRAAAAQN